MIKLISLLSVPAVVLAATAGIAQEPRTFVHEGVTYVYQSAQARDGATVLTGHTLPARTRFRLVVRDGRVSGHAGQQAVRFSVADSRGAAAGASPAPAGAAVRLAAAD